MIEERYLIFSGMIELQQSSMAPGLGVSLRSTETMVLEAVAK